MANFPDTPAWEDVLLPAPPVLKEGDDRDKFLKQVEKYLHSVFVSFMELNSALESGWLIRNPRVVSLDASKITAGTIFTQDLYIGSNQGIQLLGSQDLIIVKDKQATPQTRVRIGKLGTASDDWGIEVTDSAGNVRFRAGNTTYINGAIIVDATITNSKLADGSVTDPKVASGLSATKITTGTLTVTSSSVAIDVTGSGAVVFRNGGDIIMRATSGDTNFISFQNSSAVTKHQITYQPSWNRLVITSSSGAEIRISDSLDRIDLFTDFIGLGNGSTAKIDLLGAKIQSNLMPTVDNGWDIGSNTLRWRLVRAVTITSGDLKFENDFYITEAPDMQALDFYNHRKEWIARLDYDGNLHIKGKVYEGGIDKWQETYQCR